MMLLNLEKKSTMAVVAFIIVAHLLLNFETVAMKEYLSLENVF